MRRKVSCTESWARREGQSALQLGDVRTNDDKRHESSIGGKFGGLTACAEKINVAERLPTVRSGVQSDDGVDVSDQGGGVVILISETQ